MTQDGHILDAGHGGIDGGAKGFGVLEKDFNLRMVLYIYNRMKQLGCNVMLTRATDIYIGAEERGRIVRDSGAKYCTSHHFNAFNGMARGVETIYSIHAKPNKAERIARAIVDVSGLNYRRVFNQEHPHLTNRDYYFMHRLTGNVQTTIIEYGFIDNKNDMNYYMNDDNFFKVAERMVKEFSALQGVKYQSEEQVKENETVEYAGNMGTLKVALQDLTLKENKYKTLEVDVIGRAMLNSNIHMYKGSPNFKDWDKLLMNGNVVEFDKMTIPFKSDFVWLRLRTSSGIRQLPIATIEEFNRGKLWVDLI